MASEQVSRIDMEPSHPTTLSEWQDRANEAMAEVLRLQTLVGNIEKAMFHGGEWGGKALLVQHAAELHDDAKEARAVRGALDLAAPPGYAVGHVKEILRERGEWQARCISRGKENDELRDEIARLRRSFPVDQLREYDRRRKEAA